MAIVSPDGQPLRAVPKTVSNKEASAAIRKLEEIDPEKIIPLEYRCLLRVADVEDLTEGGIFKPESFFEKELFANTYATFVACGDEAFTDGAGDYITCRPSPGDKVITTKYAGNPYRDSENNLYRFCNDKDIVCVVKGEK